MRDKILLIVDIKQATPRWKNYLEQLVLNDFEVHLLVHYSSHSEIRQDILSNEGLTIFYSKFVSLYGRNRFLSRVLRIISNFSKLKRQQDLYEIVAGYMFYRKARTLFQEFQYHTVITSSSPFYCHIVGAKLRKKFKFSWIADYRDLWSANHVNGRQDKTMLEYERYILNAADACITVSKGLRNDLRKVYNGPIHVIYNGYHLLNKTKEIVYSKKCKVEYTGQIYGQFQNLKDPVTFFENSPISRELGVTITFSGLSSSYVSSYFRSKGRKLPGFIKTIGQLSNEEAIIRQKNANFLLFLNWNSNDDRGVIPSKIFEYISSGIPIIISGNTNDSELKQIILKSGYQLEMNTQQDLDNIPLQYKLGNLDIPLRNEKFIYNFQYSQQVKSVISVIQDPSVEVVSVVLSQF